MLRDYQLKTIHMLYDWLRHNEGNPCIVLPTGAGKSVVLAAICQDAVKKASDIRILMCTHQKELIEQDFKALVREWPDADVGIYSAGIGRKELNNQITFCGIQSIYRHYAELGKVDIIFVDEAHLISHKASGMYRTFIDNLKAINPNLKVIGLTATPYRLGHGMITDKPAIFSEPLIQPVTIKELQELGYLCQLTSKATGEKFDLSSVSMVGGDYNQKQLEEAVTRPGKTEAVVREVVHRGGDRHSWLFFCSGIKHAIETRDLVRQYGVDCECVTGETPKAERDRILEAFKNGSLQAVTNANVLTTGFDATRIDMIVLMRPTMSPGLYLQMVGRGLRIDENKRNCLVLDFAGNVLRHGPIHNVQPPKSHKRKGVAPSKVCPDCFEIVAMNASVCPSCGHEWPKKEAAEKRFQLSEYDINGNPVPVSIHIKTWRWSVETSKAGNKMIAVRYYPSVVTQKSLVEYLLLWSSNTWIRDKALTRFRLLSQKAGVPIDSYTVNAEEICNKINWKSNIPNWVTYKCEGKYKTVMRTLWREDIKDLVDEAKHQL